MAGGIESGLTGGTTSTADKLLQDKYVPGLPDYVNKKHALWGRISNAGRRVQFAGRQIIWAAQITDNEQGSLPINEGETLPTAGAIDVVNFSSKVAYYYGVARMTKQEMRFANRANAFAPATVKELDSSRNTLIERMAVDSMYGTGYGERGVVASYSGTTLTMVATTVKGGVGTRFLKRGMQLQSYSAVSGGSQGANHVLVGAVTPGGTTATVPGSAGFVANDILFLSREASKDPRNKNLMGLPGIIDDGTLLGTIFGLSRTIYPELKAIRQHNSGTLRQWTPELTQALLTSVSQDGGNGKPTALYSRREIIDRAAIYLWPDRRGSFTEMTLPHGYKAVKWTDPDYGDLPWLSDRALRPHCIYAVNEDDLGWAIDEDVQYEDWGVGNNWSRALDRTHAFEATLYTWKNLIAGFEGFNTHGLLDDVSMIL